MEPLDIYGLASASAPRAGEGTELLATHDTAAAAAGSTAARIERLDILAGWETAPGSEQPNALLAFRPEGGEQS